MVKYSLALIIAAILLVACGQQTNMKKTESGSVYEVITKGTGETMVEGDYVYFNSAVVSLEGDVIQSTADSGQPGIIKLLQPTEGQPPNPFAEVLIGASIGDSINIHLTKEESQGSGFDSLIYTIGVIESVDEAGYRAKLEEERAKRAILLEGAKAEEAIIAAKVADIHKSIKDKTAKGIQTTASGLKYIIHEKGNGDLIPVGTPATVNYYGVLLETGEEFDNSWKKGKPFTFPLGKGRVIRGWDEGVALLPKGSKATLILPGSLAYGERGSGAKIGPNAELVFYIEVPE